MSSLPEGWVATKLIEVCTLNPAKPKSDQIAPDLPVTFVPMAAVDAGLGTIATASIREYSAVAKGFTSFQENDVIMAKITPCMENGKAAIARRLSNGIGFGSTEFHVFRPSAAVLPEYVFHFIRQELFRKSAEANMTGSVGQKRVPASFLNEYDFPLPPLAEQRRIVAKLNPLIGSIEAYQQRLVKIPVVLKRFRQAVLAAACSGKLTVDWRAKEGGSETASRFLESVQELRKQSWKTKNGTRTYPAPIEHNEKELPEIPTSWLWTSADALCSQITDGEHIQPPYQTYGRPLLTAKHVREGFVTFENAGFISEPDFNKCLQRCAPENGDILIVSVGATTGRSAIVENRPPFAIVRSVLLLKPLIHSKYLLRWIQSPWCFQWMTQASGASAQPHFYIRDTKRMPVPLPPEAEQQEIVRHVETLFKLADQIEALYQRAKPMVDKLPQSILAKAFRGELVPTEAELARREGRDYEPATVLLKRVRSERAEHAQGRKGKARSQMKLTKGKVSGVGISKS